MAAPDIRSTADLRKLSDMRAVPVVSVAPVHGVITGNTLALTWSAVTGGAGYSVRINTVSGQSIVGSGTASLTVPDLPIGAVSVTVYALIGGELCGGASWSGTVVFGGSDPDPGNPDPGGPDPGETPWDGVPCGTNLRVVANIRVCPDMRGGSGSTDPGGTDPGGSDPGGVACGADLRVVVNIRHCSNVRGGDSSDPGGTDPGDAPWDGMPCGANLRLVANIRACPDVRGSVSDASAERVSSAAAHAISGTVHIWNMALGWVGTRTVASENESTQEAIQCRLYWNTARRAALRDFPWNFAQGRSRLAERALPSAWEGAWLYAYAMPDHCLKVHSIRAPGGKPQPYRIIGGEGTGLLLTDARCAIVEFTCDVLCPQQWDDVFVGMMARKLACMIAVPLLKNNTAKVQELESLYRSALPEAYEANASEQRDGPEADSWITARHGEGV